MRELLRRHCADPEHPLLVVVPTREAVRQLREQLAIGAAAGGSNGAFLCPRIISASQLTAGQPDKQAPPLLQQAALFSVLRREAERFPLLARPAGEGCDADYIARAGQFCQLYTTLYLEGVDARGSSDAARALAAENPLWQELFSLYSLLCNELHQHGWIAPAEAAPLALAPGTRIILACIPSLSERARQMLEASEHEVEVWLHTDECHEGPGWFDAWGRPGDNWLAIPADDVLGFENEDGWSDRFCVCGDMERMAEETARAAGRCGGKSVAVGVCDPGMEAAVCEAFARYGVATVRPRGVPFSASAWQKLLRLLTRQTELLEQTGHEAVETDRLSAEIISALLRNPIITSGLNIPSPARAAAEADKLMQRSLPASFGNMLRHAPASLQAPLRSLGEWLSRALSSCENLLAALRELAAGQLVEGAPPALEEATGLAATFTEQVDTTCRQLQESQWLNELPVSVVLNLLNTAGGFASPPHPPRALSLRGWLELSFAPEEHMVLAGLHDGIIPERWPASPYLTPAVIRRLELPRDEARAARDAYLLRSLYSSRRGKVMAVFSLLNARRDPLFPSSCFFRLTQQNRLAEFVAHFFDRSRPIPATAQLAADSTGWDYRRLTLPAAEDDISRLAQLRLEQIGLPNPMAGRPLSPSTLRQFFACPLRFWLMKLHSMKDESLSSTKRDLDASDMGTYLHDALEDFVSHYPSQNDFLAAHPDCRKETLVQRVEGELDAAFTRVYEQKHGRPELLPRQFQCAAMRRRLRSYAPLHVQLWQEGWETARDEHGKPILEHSVDWEFDGHPLHFIIDRIDCRLNPETGLREYRVIDYKTGKVDSCYKNHLEALPLPSARTDLHLLSPQLEPLAGPDGRTKHAHLRWKDLQLPLYTAWALAHFEGCPVNSAYIRLSSNPEDVGVLAWGDSDKNPDFFAPRCVEGNANYPAEANAEPLYDNALRWIRFGLDAIADGRCFVSAEMMKWKPPHENYDLFGDLLALGSLGEVLLRYTPTPEKD